MHSNDAGARPEFDSDAGQSDLLAAVQEKIDRIGEVEDFTRSRNCDVNIGPHTVIFGFLQIFSIPGRDAFRDGLPRPNIKRLYSVH